MLFPIDTVAILLYVGTIAGLQSRLLGGPLLAGGVLSAALFMLMNILFCFFLSWITARLLSVRIRTSPQLDRRTVYGSFDLLQRIGVAASTILMLELSGFPFYVANAIAPVSADAYSLAHFLCLNFFGVMPYLLASIAAWMGAYVLHRIVVPGEWTLTQYLVHKVRAAFFVFGLWIPLTVIVAFLGGEDVESPAGAIGWLYLLGPFVLLASLVWMFPAFLRVFWGCRRLKDADMLARIHKLEARAGVRFSGIYLWRLGGANGVNAAAVGVLPPFRYLFLSEGLLKSMPPEEVEAVVGHELGHAKHGHLLFFLIFTQVFMGMLYALLRMLRLGIVFELVMTVAALALYIRICFGWFSRRFERQADLTSAQLMGSPWPLIRGLERIGLLYGNIRNAPSWHHMSIDQRVRFLRMYEQYPALGQSHHTHVRAVRISGYCLAAILMVSLVWMWGRDFAQYQQGQDVYDWQQMRMHGQRLRRIMPDSPEGAILLTQYYLHSQNPGYSVEKATHMAEEAVRLSQPSHRPEVAHRLQALFDKSADVTFQQVGPADQSQ